MANHRPKSLSELNQVYDKAMQAQRAIKEGSQSLSTKDEPKTEAPSQNIFEELRQQAGAAKKTEIYDSQIADIANDFLKRYAKPEPAKAQTAPKEIKRPAPSIQSLYHTPVKQEQPSKDISMGESSPVEIKVPSSGAVRPKAFESIEAPSEKIAPPQATQPAPAEENYEAAPQQTVQFTVPEAYLSPQNRMTSAERNDLINEYKRVMSDDDDGWYDDDDEEYSKPKKSGFWSRIKKRRQEPVQEEAPSQPEESVQNNLPEDEDGSLDMTDIYSDISEYPAEEEKKADEADDALPMSLYDYIEADFDYGEETEIAEEITEPVPEAEEIAEEAETTVETEEVTEEAEAAVEAEEITEEAEATVEAEKITEEAEAIVEAEEVTEEAEAITEAEEAEEVVIYPEEEIEEAAPSQELPTAGMVFDDIFSVSDESKRSYTGGDWSHTEDESPLSDMESDADTDETEKAEAVKPKKKQKNKKAKKKLHPAIKVILSLVLVILIALAGAVTALGTVMEIDTGKLFGDSYRAFSAQHNLSSCGISSGDLLVTQDAGTSALSGDAFVYYNNNTAEFMLAKLNGTTYGLTGDQLYVAENEAGNVLILREDTLGTVVKVYVGIGSLLSSVSKNFIVIDAVILLLAVAIILLLALTGTGKKRPAVKAEISHTAESEEEYGEDTDELQDTDGNEDADDDSFDEEEYDDDDLTEGLFSGI